jgi:hypothetical protein
LSSLKPKAPKPKPPSKPAMPKPPAQTRSNLKKTIAAKMGRIVHRYQGK